MSLLARKVLEAVAVRYREGPTDVRPPAEVVAEVLGAPPARHPSRPAPPSEVLEEAERRPGKASRRSA